MYIMYVLSTSKYALGGPYCEENHGASKTCQCCDQCENGLGKLHLCLRSRYHPCTARIKSHMEEGTHSRVSRGVSQDMRVRGI